ncbi:MAG TPA: nucleoside deaminase, partial [Bacteroides sp.]|nr:nucleoside deaminase [Bacteroides sp.]
MTDHRKYLELAIEEAFTGMRSGEGGPFGAVIVKDGKIIGKGHNSVLASRDPTAH